MIWKLIDRAVADPAPDAGNGRVKREIPGHGREQSLGVGDPPDGRLLRRIAGHRRHNPGSEDQDEKHDQERRSNDEAGFTAFGSCSHCAIVTLRVLLSGGVSPHVGGVPASAADKPRKMRHMAVLAALLNETEGSVDSVSSTCAV